MSVINATQSQIIERNILRLLSCSYRLLLVTFLLGAAFRCHAQESPYFVTYDHYLEEPGSLDLEYFSTFGTQRAGNDFHANWTELEYGATAWWTTEFYLDGQTTFNDSTIFTGFRFENRFRVLQHEHFINPVLYVEYEQINEADKILKEIEGHDVEADAAHPNALARQEHAHELETKLILSSTFKGWNVAQNTIATKNLTSGDPWEFGYAIGASRPLSLKASAQRCNFCAQNFVAGLEMYGGLGDRYSFGWRHTSQYLGPTVAFNIPKGPSIVFSPSFGLNDNSVGVLWRFKVSYEIQQIGSYFRRGQ